jgi:predicted RNA-binding Zn-ribbon protein involved in translation (DUF1610 family)
MEVEAMDEQEPRPVFFARRPDFRRATERHARDAIFERLWAEIKEPDFLRSVVITLHLYVEYWLVKLLECHRIAERAVPTFHRKATRLRDLGALSPENFGNIDRINKIRNIYAHELDLERAEPRVRQLLEEMWLDPYFLSNDPDGLRAISIQTMYLLEAAWNNGGRPPDIEYPASEMRAKLIREGLLHWGECLSLSVEELNQYERRWTLLCPLCGEGNIIRYKDDTPGFRESNMGRCTKCRLTGDGSNLQLETADSAFRTGEVAG